MNFFFGKTTTFCFFYHLCFAIKTPVSCQSFGKPFFENHVARSTTRSIFWYHFFARGLAQTPTQQRNKMHHREKCAAQGDSIKVVEEECIARALAHNISEQAKKLLFLRDSLHLRTHSLSNGRVTLRRWLCGRASWLGLTGWLLEWSSGPIISLVLINQALGHPKMRFSGSRPTEFPFLHAPPPPKRCRQLVFSPREPGRAL